MRIQFKRIVTLNRPKKYRTPTIFISNHPSSFMDPLSLSVVNNPIVHFMVRADVFKAWLVPIFSSAQMFPIYREHDGGKKALEKNQESFAKAEKVLGVNKGLIIFAEGFTDDVFIRRLKPIKKGPARIAIGAMERYDWNKEIFIQCVGQNYTNPGKMRSELLMCYGERVSLLDYKAVYNENPNKAINQITKYIRKTLKEQLTHVENEKNAPFHEQIMRLTRKGMSEQDYDPSLSLEQRFRYSQELALKINEVNFEEEQGWSDVKEETASYFSALKDQKIREEEVFEYQQKGKVSAVKDHLKRIAAIPFFLVALIHCAPIYLFVKRFVEKTFKRKVFWSSVKMVMGMILLGFYNIILAILFYNFVYDDWLITIGYYFATTPIVGVITYDWIILATKNIKKKRLFKALSSDAKNSLIKKRQSLLDRLSQLGIS